MDEVKGKTQDPEETLNIAAQIRANQLRGERELRGLELKAYSGVLEALRASGKPNTEKEKVIKTLRDYFNITEDRHKAEVRVLAADQKLSLISKKLTGYDFTDEWSAQSQRTYVPLGAQAFSLYRTLPTDSSNRIVIRDPVPSGRLKEEFASDDSDSYSESELDILDNIIETAKSNGWTPGSGSEKQKGFSIAVDPGTGNEKEIEELEEKIKKGLKNSGLGKKQHSRSPDITEGYGSSKLKSAKNTRKSGAPVTSRGMKRRKLDPVDTPSTPLLSAENSTKLTARKLAEKSKNMMKTTTKSKSKMKLVPSHRIGNKKVKESSEETSSADEGEDGPNPPDESSRVLSPVFSEVIRTSVVSRGRGGRRLNDRRRNNILKSASPVKVGKSRPRTPNQKASKLKSATATSGSRRKSKLNEKIDYDDLLMDLDGNELRRHSKTRNVDDLSRRHLYDNQINDGVRTREYKISDDCAVYTDSLPVNYNHEDMEQVTDGVFKRPLPPSKGPKLWEIKDARLNHYHQQLRNEKFSDENTERIAYSSVGIDGIHGPPQLSSPPQQINVNDLSPPTTPPKTGDSPPSKKQRLKSPLIINPSINSTNSAKVPSTSVYSSNLNPSSKKRNNTNINASNNNNKPISVVDSLNLHLPTSATASSLAASSNNRRLGATPGGGCSMFSNSSALIAGARGTAPGILQQQRKAQPHILSTSKVHQRSFLPTANSTVTGSSVNSNIIPLVGHPVPVSGSSIAISTSPGTPTGINVNATPIPIAVSSNNSSVGPLPFPTFPCSPPPTLSVGSQLPIGQVNRPAPGTNIIFVQKTNGPVVSSSTEVPNMIPLKSPPRAVILRRAQLPRQGNLIIFDGQKNHLVNPSSGQAPSFLQTARVINASGEISLVNLQPPPSSPTKINSSSMGPPPLARVVTNASPVPTTTVQQQISKFPVQGKGNSETIVESSSPGSYITISSENSPQFAPTVIENSETAISSTASAGETNELSDSIPVSPSNTENQNDEVVQETPNDDQYAQIEAELLQMEEGNFGEVVYEEEVTTEIVPFDDNDTTQYIFTNDNASANEGGIFLVSQESAIPSNDALSSVSSTTETAATNPELQNNFEASSDDDSNKSLNAPATKVSISPMREMKLATEAISRALSLSKSTAKRLTFTTPISFSTAATLASNLAISSKSSCDGKDPALLPGNAPQISIVPSSMFQTAPKEINPTAVIIESDTSSTNTVHIGKPQTVEFTLHNNEIL